MTDERPHPVVTLCTPDVPTSAYKYVRLVHISDTHQKLDVRSVAATHTEVAGAPTILVHSGDFSQLGRGQEEFMAAFASLPHTHKLLVCGNHDRNAMTEEFARESESKGIVFLVDRAVTIEGIAFYGMPWGYHGPGWSLGPQELQDRIAMIRPGTQVLITHMPPRLVLDLAFVSSTADNGYWHCTECGQKHRPRFAHWGHPLLKAAVERLGVRVHLFGHVHDSSGMQGGEGTGCLFSNASETGIKARPPHIIDIAVDGRQGQHAGGHEPSAKKGDCVVA